MKQKIIGIHQPNFLPYLGYFHKIYMSDVFIFHDNVEYSKRSMTKRTFIRKIPKEKIYLSIPLRKSDDKTLIKDLIIDNSINWQDKFLNIIRNTYQKAPYFKIYFPVIKNMLDQSKKYVFFSEYSIFLTKSILDILGVKREILISSKIKVNGYKSMYNINLIKYCDGNVYNSGVGARKYQAEEEFKENNIVLNYLDLNKYIEDNIKEFPDGFINGISIIDYLFIFGKEFILNLFYNYSNIQNQKD